MGRWSYGGKQEADYLKKIHAWWLKKHGYLSPGWKSGTIKWTNGFTGQESTISIQTNIFEQDNYIRLFYAQTDEATGEKRDFDYKIFLTTTHCHFGGERYWFICPLTVSGVYCGKRVATLYKGGDYFGCRHCHNLTYDSKNSNRRSRHFPLFATLDGFRKMEELERRIKVRYYRGKPTRRQQRLNRLQIRLLPYMAMVSKMK